jgi:UDP-glucose 4-epimerase
MNILVTGGAGYIGSHVCVELLVAGFSVVVYDNFCNGNKEAPRRVEEITSKKLTVIKGDVRDEERLFNAMREYSCGAIIHFAGLKAVGESVKAPLDYYDNNVVGLLCLLRAMRQADVKTLVFSSSATVYGEPQFLPLTEDHPLRATNPYGRTKLFIEEILRDLFRAEADWRIFILRYFNPVGAHVSGLIGEDPRDIPNNLMPFVAQVAVGRRDRLNIWGSDYDTIDGTGVRDYIHVVDLARGHVSALQKLNAPLCEAVNLGTGRGNSVLEVVSAFEAACGKKINYRFAQRRSGDVASCYADASFAEKRLNWRATRTLEEMCADAWRWQSQNSNGYTEA